MALKLNEVAISKCTSVKLDDDTIAMVGVMYHTADKKENPDDKSWYTYEGRVCKIADLEAEVKAMKGMDRRLELWRWPDPTWPAEWFMGYDNSNQQLKGARFYQMKLKKALDWDSYIKLVTKGIKMMGEKKNKEKFYPSAKYDTEGYVDQDGKTFSIIDKDALLARVNKCFSKKLPLKRG